MITICAQPSGVQGVKLIESVIRPDCLCNPSKAQDREGQCLEITYLKEELRKKLEQGQQESYVWKRTKLKRCLKNNLIDLLGSEYYEEVLWSFKQWLAVDVRDELLEDDDKVNESGEYQSFSENVIITTLQENGLVQEGQPLEEAIKFMARSILSLRRKVDVTHEEVLKIHDRMDQMTKKLDEMHEEIKCMRNGVMNNVQKSIGKLLKMALENEAEKQLPRVALLTTKYSDSTIERLLTWVPKVLLGGEFVRIQLYCEDKNLTHLVENQSGITLTSLTNSEQETLERALPYMKGFFYVLTIAARLGLSSVAPVVSSLVPDCTPHFKLAKQYPMIQRHTMKLKKDIFLSKLECASKEWQKCLSSILKENGGLTDENIAKKFGLHRAIYNQTHGSTQVAWLCETHYKGQRPFPLD